MKATFLLRNVRLRKAEALADLLVHDGIVAEIAPASTLTVADVPIHDLKGALLIPGFVDVHVHLDKAFQMPYLDAFHDEATGVEGAMKHTAELRAAMTPEVTARNAGRLLRQLANGGTVGARAHVEISPDTDPAMVGVHADLAAEHPEIALELTAFAQHGTTGHDGIIGRMTKALEQGCSVVGGCPYADSEPLHHLDDMIALALDHDVLLDLHLDLSDDAEDLMLQEVVPRVEKAGMQGRVLIGHVTALTAAAPAKVHELVTATAGAGIAVVSIPSTDLYLSGRGQLSAPTRGVTRIAEFVDAGVRVALASNNHENAFTPVSMPSLTLAAWLASLTNYMDTSSKQLALLDAITTVPRTILAKSVPGIEVGDIVGGAVLDVDSPLDVVRTAARPTALVSASRGLYTPETFVRSTSGVV